MKPEDVYEKAERAKLVQEALASLTESQRDAIILHYYMGKAYHEIAAFLNVSESTISNRIYAGKKKLKKIMLISMSEYLGGFDMNQEAFVRQILAQVSGITTQDPRIQENFQFCGCMRAIMQYLGKDPMLNFVYFAGVSGALFSNVWRHNKKWMYSESTVAFLPYEGRDEIIKSTIRTAGYDSEVVSEKEIKADKKKYKKKIMESLNKGMPVMTYGIVGPPTCSLITGYDENGEILIGWAAFQDGEHGMPDGYEDCGYFRQRNGLDESNELIFIGDMTDAMRSKDIVKTAMKNIRHTMTIPKTDENVFGVEAFEHWAEAFADDDEFKDDRELLDNYTDVHCGQKTIVMTGSTYAEQFLQILKSMDSTYDECIDKMIPIVRKEKDALDRFWQLEPEFWYDSKKLLDKGYRDKVMGIINEAKEYYSELVNVVCSYVHQ